MLLKGALERRVYSGPSKKGLGRTASPVNRVGSGDRHREKAGETVASRGRWAGSGKLHPIGPLGEGLGSSSNLPPRRAELRNHKSMSHHRRGRLWECFFFLFFFLKDQYSFFFISPYNENRLLNASNIQISLMHTHSRKAEVCAATR